MRHPLLPLILIAALTGCGDSGGDARRHQVSGQFDMGDATLQFVATFEDSVLVAVEEHQNFGDLGTTSAVYQVVDGRLASYHSEESRLRTAPDATGHEQVELILEFDAAGHVLSQHKSIDGNRVELVGYEAPGVQRHFAELSRRALAEDQAVRAGMR